MKRSFSHVFWVFLSLVVVNIWVSVVLVVATRQWKIHWAETILPTFTLIVFRAAYIWPAIAILTCLAGAGLALSPRMRDPMLWCLAIVIAVIEIWLLSLHALGWVLPSIYLDYPIGMNG